MAPENKTSLILEISCLKDDEIWQSTDQKLIERSLNDLDKLGLPIKNKIIDAFVINEPHAYPIYHLDYKDKVNRIIKKLFTVDNLLPLGRSGLFCYNNMDHSIKMGFLAARHITEGIPKEELLKEENYIGFDRAK